MYLRFYKEMWIEVPGNLNRPVTYYDTFDVFQHFFVYVLIKDQVTGILYGE